MSKRRARSRRRGGWQPWSATSTKTKLPFPYSIIANVKLFYLLGIIVMIVGLVGGVLFTFGGSSSSNPHAQRPSPTARDDGETVAAEERQNRAVQFKTYEAPPPLLIDPGRRYLATIETEKGAIRVELFAKEAPQTVNNFVFLAREGFYDGLAFHYVLKGFIAQSGDPACKAGSGGCSGLDGPGYTLPKEVSSLTHKAGVLAMVNQGDASHGSQFYITYGDLSQRLDGSDVVFGRVVDGTNVLQSLTETNPRQPLAPPGDRIVRVSVEETR